MIQINTDYLRADKSIEKYIHNGKIIYIFNNQGLYFDIFFSKEKLKAFFDNKISRGDLFFDSENQLNKYFKLD